MTKYLLCAKKLRFNTNQHTLHHSLIKLLNPYKNEDGTVSTSYHLLCEVASLYKLHNTDSFRKSPDGAKDEDWIAPKSNRKWNSCNDSGIDNDSNRDSGSDSDSFLIIYPLPKNENNFFHSSDSINSRIIIYIYTHFTTYFIALIGACCSSVLRSQAGKLIIFFPYSSFNFNIFSCLLCPSCINCHGHVL